MAPGDGHAGAPAMDLAGWQAQMLAAIVERDEKGLYPARSKLNGHTLAGWLSDDCPYLPGDELTTVLTVALMTVYAFVLDLAKNTDQANGQYAMARAVVLGAFEDACQCAVLDLTAVARSGA